MQKVRATVFLDDTTKNAVLKIATDEKRTESNVLNILVLEALVERGRTKQDTGSPEYKEYLNRMDINDLPIDREAKWDEVNQTAKGVSLDAIT